MIHSIEICDLPPHLKPAAEVQPRRRNNGGNSDPNSVFIYTPIRSNQQRTTLQLKQWVAGESALVKVTISNPLSCNLAVEMLCLHAKGVRFEGYPSGPIMLPKKSAQQVVSDLHLIVLARKRKEQGKEENDSAKFPVTLIFFFSPHFPNERWCCCVLTILNDVAITVLAPTANRQRLCWKGKRWKPVLC